MCYPKIKEIIVKKANKIITTLLLLSSLAIATTSTFVNTVIASTDDTTDVQKTNNLSPKSNNQEVESQEPLPALRNTIKGKIGISKVWVSGGEIWYALKVTNKLFPVFHWDGTLKIHYYASSTKKARSVSYPVGGNGVYGKWWEDSKRYARGRHGYAELSGTIDGFVGYIEFPRSAF